jgi:hypothetical protein
MTATARDNEMASRVLEEWAVLNGWAAGAVAKHPAAIDARGLIAAALSAAREEGAKANRLLVPLICPTCNDYLDEEAVCWACHGTEVQVAREQERERCEACESCEPAQASEAAGDMDFCRLHQNICQNFGGYCGRWTRREQ